MSEAVPPPASLSASPKPPKRRRTWRQRFKLLVLVGLILAFCFRIALNALLPTVINKVANAFDLDCGYDRLDLSLLGGTAHVWNLKLRPKAGGKSAGGSAGGSAGESIVQCDFISGDISPLNLLRARLVVYRAEVDGVAVVVERAADGSVPLLSKFLSTKPAAKAAAPAAGKPQPFNLQAPLRVDAIRLSHVTARLHDRSVTPNFDATVRTDVRLSDVGAAQGPARFELEVGVDPLLDTLRVAGDAVTTPDSLKADVQVLLRGLHPKLAAGYLRPLGLRPVADTINLQANLTLTATTIPNSADVTVAVAADHVSAVTDGAAWASLATFALDAKRLGVGGAELGKITVADGFANARRTPEGAIRVAGFELAPVAAAAPATGPTPPVPAAPPAITVASSPPFHLSLDEIDLRELQATVTDDAVRPAAEWVARLDALNAKGIDTAPAVSNRPVQFSVAAALPGLLRSVAVTGEATPFAAAKALVFHAHGDGLRPDVLRPYLERFGVESQLNRGRFDADVSANVYADPDGKITAGVSAAGVRLDDGPTPLLAMETAKLDDVSYTPADGSIAVGAIELAGPTLRVVRDEDGHLAAAGFKLVPPTAVPRQTTVPSTQPATLSGSAPAAASPAVTGLPKLAIGRLRWGGINLTVEDRMTPSSPVLALTDAGVELDDLLLDLGSADPERRPGKFRAHFTADGVARQFAVDGSFDPLPNTMIVRAAVTGRGLSGDRVAPYVRGLGLVPTLKDGSLDAKATLAVSQTAGTLGVNLDLADVKYADGGTELAGVDAMKLSGLTANTSRVAVDELSVRRPRVRVSRLADGTFEAGGVHVVPPPAGAAPSATPATSPAPTTLTLRPLPIEFGLKRLRVDDASIDWSDAVPAAPVNVHATASVALDDVDVSDHGGPATLHATAGVDDALKRATVDGTLGLSPVSPSAKLAVVADGLRAGPLAAYLPPAVESTLADGHFAVNVEAAVADHPAGGLMGRFAIDHLDFTDAGGATPLAKVDAFTLDAARIDPAAGVFAVAELSSAGVAADVRQSADGLLAAGVRLRSAPAPATRPADAPPTTGPAAAPSAPVAALSTFMEDARRALPTLTIDKLDLGLARLSLAGFTGADAAPVVLRDVRLTSLGPLTLGGADAENAKPLRLSVVGGVDPIVGAFKVDLHATPFAGEPNVGIDVVASGIKGAGLTAVLPALAAKLDGSALTDGTLNTHVDASIDYGRRGPRDFDVGRGFTAEFDVRPVEFRTVGGGPVVAGVGQVHGDGIHVEPRGGNVAVKSLEISTPVARVYRDDAGVHAAGLLLRLGPGETAETLAPAPPTTAEAPTKAPSAGATPGVAQRPSNEIRLDRFTVSGVDVVIEDRTSKPFTVIPLKSLDVDVQDLSNQLPWNGKAVRFSVLCTSDKVALPARKGAKGAATTRPGEGEGYTEQRELFSQVTANGKVAIARTGDAVALDGWAKTAVNGFELLGVRGLAQQYGVTVGGGSFDDTNDFRFNKDGPIETKNRVVFTNLSLSEPADGPLRRLLKLPAPIDVAIGAVTDPDGSITMDLPVPIRNGQVRAGEVVGPALGAVTGVLVTGIASAPVKAIGGVGALLGLGGSGDAKPEPPVTLAFLPAYAGLDTAASASITTLVAQLKADPALELQVRHTMTTADVERARVRANPSPEVCLALAGQVRQQKADLLGQRATLSAEARGQFGARADASIALEKLRDIDRQLARAEDSLDELYAMTTPGAAGQADRRTRAATLDIARARMAAVHDAFVRSGLPNVEERLHATNPQFDPVAADDGGDVTVTLIRKKQ